MTVPGPSFSVSFSDSSSAAALGTMGFSDADSSALTARPTTDPRVLEHTQPRGSLQLLGAQEYGHKGYGRSIWAEALSQGLSGHGRLDAPKRWGGNVFLQVMDPDCFAGLEAFEAQTGHLAQRCRSSKPIDPNRPVRMPGDQAARSLALAQREGIGFDTRTWQALQQCAEPLGIAMPSA